MAVWAGVVVFLGYFAWDNQRAGHPLDARAREIACDEFSACTEDAFSLSATPFVRHYGFRSDHGTLEVECRWPRVLWGTPTCEGALTRRVSTSSERPRYPHEIQREAPALTP